MNDDRTIRDRLAEALYSASAPGGMSPLTIPWLSASDAKQRYFLERADALLTALQSPTVKLKIEGAG